MVLQFTNGEKAKAAGLGLTLDKHAFTADEVYHKVSPRLLLTRAHKPRWPSSYHTGASPAALTLGSFDCGRG